MSEYDRTNTGVISKNDRKEKDTHPDIKGSINIEGREYWLDGWQKKRNSDGATFYSLKAKPKDGQHASAPKAAQGGGGPVDLGDEIPFMCEWR